MNRTTITRTAAAGLVAGALLLTGCGSSDSGSSDTTTTKAKATTTAADTLKIDDVWARQSPMGTTAGAVYLTITSPIDDELTGASVPTSVAKTTEIHETVAADGSDSMSSTTEAMGEGTTTTVEMGGESMATTTTAAMGADEATTTEAMGSGDETTTTMAGGDTMTMKPVDAIDLPAGETVKLEPGGYHIMLLDLVAPLEKGQTFEVTLTFKEAGTKTVTATVREA